MIQNKQVSQPKHSNAVIANITDTENGLTKLNTVEDMYEKNKPMFVKLYAEWCGHCKTLAPIWTQLENRVKKDYKDKNIAIVSIETEAFGKFKNSGLKNILGTVKGFPTIGAIINKKFVPYDNDSARDLKTMVEFINKTIFNNNNNDLTVGGGRKGSRKNNRSLNKKRKCKSRSSLFTSIKKMFSYKYKRKSRGKKGKKGKKGNKTKRRN